jgi:hypothetical protein
MTCLRIRLALAAGVAAVAVTDEQYPPKADAQRST